MGSVISSVIHPLNPSNYGACGGAAGSVGITTPYPINTSASPYPSYTQYSNITYITGPLEVDGPAAFHGDITLQGRSLTAILKMVWNSD